MKPKFILLFILLIWSGFSFSQTVNISGKASLNSLTDNSNIQIVFERIAPSQLLDTTYTNQDGNYQIVLASGIYNIHYYKDNFFWQVLSEKVLYSDTELGSITLNARKRLIKVPADISTIQSAIDQSNRGDTVLISEGIYKEKLILDNKEIVIASNYILSKDTSVIAKTILDGNSTNIVIEFNNVLSNNCQVVGLTIRNGRPGIYCENSNPTLDYLLIENNENFTNSAGGGIYCKFSSLIMSNLIIRNNKALGMGGGIFLSNCTNPQMLNLTIYNNTAGQGGGIYSYYSSPNIYNSKIFNNTSMYSGGGIGLENSSKANLQNDIICNNIANGYGGGLILSNSDATINNASILNNFSKDGGGIYLYFASSPVITNSIIAYNSGKYGISNHTSSPGNPSISFCNLYGNAEQNFYNCNSYLGLNVTLNANKDSCDAWYNIQEDPKLSHVNNADYELTAASSCIDAGKNSFVNLKFDIKNNTRIFSGRNESDSIVDIGCIEYNFKVTGTDKLLSKVNVLEVYPNPFSSHITYNLGNINHLGTIQIIDLNGKLLYSKAITSTVGNINLESLCSGVYLFQIVSSDVIKTMKILKK